MARGAKPKPKPKGKRGRPKLSDEQKAKNAAAKVQRDHIKMVQQVFERAGFKRHGGISEKEVTFAPHVTTDFDHVFTHENLIVIVECTASAPGKVGEHLRKKKDAYAHIAKHPLASLATLRALNAEFACHAAGMAHPSHVLWAFVYASRYPFEEDRKDIAPGMVFLDYRELRYFKAVTDAVHVSARPELLQFLKVDASRLSRGGLVAAHGQSSEEKLGATLLPEPNSGFPAGFKVVTFYASAEALLRRAYVLRRQGWRDGEALYQRMVDANKIDRIRAHLKADRGVFINNIIVTLDPGTKLLDDKGNTVDPAGMTVTRQVRLGLPEGVNTVGLIDGQHRTFAYHVSDPDDPAIARMRGQQNLLVTGIIFPDAMPDEERQRFAAQLFLDINSTQASAKSELTQVLRRVVMPFRDDSIAFSVLERLGSGSGPLKGLIALDWLDDDKLRTSSIVSYGLKPLVKTSPGRDSLFAAWSHQGKDVMVTSEDAVAREAYVTFCAAEIDKLLIAVRQVLPNGIWKVRTRTDASGLLSTTTVNAMLHLLRKIVQADLLSDSPAYAARLHGLSPEDLRPEKATSSQYNRLADDLFKRFFAPSAPEPAPAP